jgi:hypothetical protein
LIGLILALMALSGRAQTPPQAAWCDDARVSNSQKIAGCTT